MSFVACSSPETAADTSPAAGETVAAAAPAILAPPSTADSILIARADKGRLMGRDSGAMWVVLMSDFQCPYCKQWHDQSMNNLVRDYVNTGKVRLAYLHLPLTDIHPHARAEAEASMCASVQGKFWPYAEQLFARQKEVATLPSVRPTLDAVARNLSLDMEEFAACQRSGAMRSLVDSDMQQATQARVQSTPSFLIGDFLVEGALPYADFRRAVDSALVIFRKSQETR
jgi:protein-disulfide isomerase